MDQVLHSCATTTEAIRSQARAVLRKTGSVGLREFEQLAALLSRHRP